MPDVVFEFRPMLATPVATFPDGDWAAEVKWDGVRAAAEIGPHGVRLWSRNGNDITAGYPELAPMRVDGRERAVIDGEIVAATDDGRPSFELLQQRMHTRDTEQVRRFQATIPVAFLAFDVLALGDVEQFSRPWHERRATLDELAVSGPSWRTPPVARGDAAATLVEITRQRGLEGVVAKRVDSRYEPGRRSPAWRKLKHFLSQDFVVGGHEPGSGRRTDSIGSLLLGVHEGDDLVFAGAVGSGLTDAMLPVLRDALARIERSTSPFVRGSVPRTAHFVEPVIVVEVRFANWTSAGVVRTPSYRGIRPDIDPASVVRLLPPD